jgi:Leucine-rich repeat (LRR) protein
MKNMNRVNESISSTNSKTQKKAKNETKNELVYSLPAKPIDFSFKKLICMEELRKMEPRNGIRKSIDLLNKEESEKNETFMKSGRENMGNHQSEDEENFKRTNFKAEVEEKNVEQFQQPKDDKPVAAKKKVKYVYYSNALILHSNEIKSIEGIADVLVDVLPDLEFTIQINRSKIDLIQWIDLSFNRLEDIHTDILKLPFLKILYLHANYIKEIESVISLSHCKALLNLTLHGNPIEQIKGYRHFIIEMVPCLEKLDFTLVSEKELDIIHHRGSRYGEKRNKKGEVFEYPKLDDEILKRLKMPKDEVAEKKEEI